MSKIKKILMERDGNSSDEADARIKQAIYAVNKLLDSGSIEEAYEVCQDHFGLEPDYLFELID